MSRATRSKSYKPECEDEPRDLDTVSQDAIMSETKEPSLKDIMLEVKKNNEGNKKIQNQLNGLKSSVDTNTTTLENHMAKHDDEIKGMNATLDDLRLTVNTLTDRIDTVTEEAKEAKEENIILRKRLNEVERTSQKYLRQEEDAKRRNIVIEGLKEASFQKTKDDVTELLTVLGIEMSPMTVVNLHRLGKQQSDALRPRPVKVIFLSNLTKQTLYKNISQLKNDEKWKNISINDDVTEEVKNIQRDLRCLAASAKAKGLKAQQKGKALILEGQRYMYNEIDNLPHDISLENAKVIKTCDGVAFQGEHAYLSNLAPSPFVYDGADYHCV